jgi:malate synthase
MPPAVSQAPNLMTKMQPGDETVLTEGALAFVAELHTRFDGRRRELLVVREQRQAAWDGGATPGFLPGTAHIRDDPAWRVGPIPETLLDRRVEITGPVDRKMVINALNSGAKTFMADFEDSNSPTWRNLIEGQCNMMDAVRGTISLATEKKTYALNDAPATLLIRPRGWHLPEAHLHFDGQPASASLVDFGLFAWHNAKQQLERGAVPAFYLPKLEHHDEAKLWDDVFSFTEDALDIPHGSLKATVLLETFPAVFQMEEILFALKDHIVGLNAGRWDFMFSAIKTFRNHPDRILPDRAQLTMTVPFMHAYTELLIQTCHQRGAFAMGGMSAFIPDRRNADVTENALKQVRADKQREADDGCDGTWVAHPDLVPVALEIFDAAFGDASNQIHKQRPKANITEADLLNFHIEGGAITRAGLRTNIDVALQYIEAWLGGRGAVAIHNLMEDAATAEISRSQVWQWVHHGAKLEDEVPITAELIQGIIQDIKAKLVAGRNGTPHHFDEAAGLFEDCALADVFPAFLTLPAYNFITTLSPASS